MVLIIRLLRLNISRRSIHGGNEGKIGEVCIFFLFYFNFVSFLAVMQCCVHSFILLFSAVQTDVIASRFVLLRPFSPPPSHVIIIRCVEFLEIFLLYDNK